MPINLGSTNPEDVKNGESGVIRIMVGTTQVWPAGSPPPVADWTDVTRYMEIGSFVAPGGGQGNLTLSPDGSRVIRISAQNAGKWLSVDVYEFNEPFKLDSGHTLVESYVYEQATNIYIQQGCFFSPSGSHLFTWWYDMFDENSYLRSFLLKGPYDLSEEPTLLHTAVIPPANGQPMFKGISDDGMTLYWVDFDTDDLRSGTLLAPNTVTSFDGSSYTALDIDVEPNSAAAAVTPDSRIVMYFHPGEGALRTFEMTTPGNLTTANLVLSPEAVIQMGFRTTTHRVNVDFPVDDPPYGSFVFHGLAFANYDWFSGMKLYLGITGFTEI